jgi:hypothetical protein
MMKNTKLTKNDHFNKIILKSISPPRKIEKKIQTSKVQKQTLFTEKLKRFPRFPPQVKRTQTKRETERELKIQSL